MFKNLNVKIKDKKQKRTESHEHFTIEYSSTRILPDIQCDTHAHNTHAPTHNCLSNIFMLSFSFYKVDFRLFILLSEMRASQQQQSV